MKEFLRPTLWKVMITLIPLLIILLFGIFLPGFCVGEAPMKCYTFFKPAVIADLILVIPLYLFVCLVFLIVHLSRTEEGRMRLKEFFRPTLGRIVIFFVIIAVSYLLLWQLLHITLDAPSFIARHSLDLPAVILFWLLNIFTATYDIIFMSDSLAGPIYLRPLINIPYWYLLACVFSWIIGKVRK